MKRILFALSLMAATTASFAQVAKPMEDVNKVIDNTADSLNKAMTARIQPGTSRKGNNPVLFLIGNSTMRNGTLGNGNNGQWGWGYYEHEFFDANKITIENQALGGMSSRTFYNRLWPDVRKGIKACDWVSSPSVITTMGRMIVAGHVPAYLVSARIHSTSPSRRLASRKPFIPMANTCVNTSTTVRPWVLILS